MSRLHHPIYAPELLVNALNQDPTRPLLKLLSGERLTVGDVRDGTSQYIQVFESLGIKPGSRVGLLSSNKPEVLLIANAVQISAAIYVPMHPLGGFKDHLHVVQDSKIDVLIFDADTYSERAEQLSKEVPGLTLFSIGESKIAEDLTKTATQFEAKKLIAPRVNGDDVLRLGYSGGTTGKPKALASVQRTGLATISIMMSEWEWPSHLKFLSCTPLSHAGAAMFLPVLLKGGTMMVLPTFNPEQVLKTIQEEKINCIMLVPTMIYALLDHPEFDKYDLSSLETVFYGASAIAPARLKEAIERIGPVFMQFYGQAEAPMAVSILRKHEHDIDKPDRLASCGRPVPWLNVALLDSDNRPVPLGEPGEICVRGPLVMNGYRDNPDLTAEAFSGDWLHSGDVAVQDKDGFLRIIDRTKDMIVTGGFNVYPREIEDILAEHPGISQVAVIGVPHKKWGESITALIVKRADQAVDPEELIAMVADRKGSYQAPKSVEFIDEIPLTPVGKPDKKQLKQWYIDKQ